MNIKKFRHKKPRNGKYINKEVVVASCTDYKNKQFNLDTIELPYILKYNRLLSQKWKVVPVHKAACFAPKKDRN